MLGSTPYQSWQVKTRQNKTVMLFSSEKMTKIVIKILESPAITGLIVHYLFTNFP